MFDRPADELKDFLGAKWFEVDVNLPADTFKVQFVVYDEGGAVDNNKMRDYVLHLHGAPTEEEVLAERIRKFEQAESLRSQVIIQYSPCTACLTLCTTTTSRH